MTNPPNDTKTNWHCHAAKQCGRGTLQHGWYHCWDKKNPLQTRILAFLWLAIGTNMPYPKWLHLPSCDKQQTNQGVRWFSLKSKSEEIHWAGQTRRLRHEVKLPSFVLHLFSLLPERQMEVPQTKMSKWLLIRPFAQTNTHADNKHFFTLHTQDLVSHFHVHTHVQTKQYPIYCLFTFPSAFYTVKPHTTVSTYYSFDFWVNVNRGQTLNKARRAISNTISKIWHSPSLFIPNKISKLCPSTPQKTCFSVYTVTSIVIQTSSFCTLLTHKWEHDNRYYCHYFQLSHIYLTRQDKHRG